MKFLQFFKTRAALMAEIEHWKTMAQNRKDPDSQMPAMLARVKELQERDPQSEALSICEKRCAMLQDIANNHAKATERMQELRALLVKIDPVAIERAKDTNASVLDVAVKLLKEGRGV